MHTRILIGVEFLLLAGCLVVGGVAGGYAALPKAALVLVPLWLVGMMAIAIRVKLSDAWVAMELSIVLLLFAVHSILSLSLWWPRR